MKIFKNIEEFVSNYGKWKIDYDFSDDETIVLYFDFSKPYIIEFEIENKNIKIKMNSRTFCNFLNKVINHKNCDIIYQIWYDFYEKNDGNEDLICDKDIKKLFERNEVIEIENNDGKISLYFSDTGDKYFIKDFKIYCI